MGSPPGAAVFQVIPLKYTAETLMFLSFSPIKFSVYMAGNPRKNRSSPKIITCHAKKLRNKRMLAIPFSENFMPCSSYMKLYNLLVSISVRSRNILKEYQWFFKFNLERFKIQGLSNPNKTDFWFLTWSSASVIELSIYMVNKRACYGGKSPSKYIFGSRLWHA